MTTAKTYTINTPGAKTLTDARRYMIDGKPVTAEVTADTITIFVGCTIAHTAPNTGNLNTITEVADYVIATLDNATPVQASRKSTVVINNVIVQDGEAYDIITAANFDSRDCVGCSMDIRSHRATHTRETYTPAITRVVNVRASFTQAPVCEKFAAWHIAKNA